MDAFEKLAKLAGASVESVGEGLPRTRAEALVLGVKWYFTGKPCLRGHVAERYTSVRRCCECWRQNKATPEGKERQRQRDAAPERNERRRGYKLAKTGDAALFSISQAERAAVSGRAPADIIPQCPEPQRSQLQALVDRIKVDPRAGKAVIGLLRTMRELRKAELAEMKAAAEGGAA